MSTPSGKTACSCPGSFCKQRDATYSLLLPVWDQIDRMSFVSFREGSNIKKINKSVCGVGGKNPEQIREKKRPIFCAFFSKEQNITQFQCLYVNQALLIVILQKVLLKAALLLKEAKG